MPLPATLDAVPGNATIGFAGPGPMSPTSPDSRRSARAPYGRALVAVVLLLTLTASGAAVLPQQTGRVDLLSQPSLRIDGAAALDQAGASVAGAGDVNGDGLDDLLVGAPERGPLNAGAAYVVFGRETPENVNLGALGRDGFRITGAAGGGRAGVAVAGAGDVNGDGLDDVLVGLLPTTTGTPTPARRTWSSAGGRPTTSISPTSARPAFALTGRRAPTRRAPRSRRRATSAGTGWMTSSSGPPGAGFSFGGRRLRRVRPGDVHERGSRRPRGGRLPDERVRIRR